MPTPFDMSRIPAADEAGEGPYGCQPLIASLDRTSAVVLDMGKELQNETGCKVAHRQPLDGLSQLLASEG